ncbi:hypothetical protein [Halobacterium zhouii]|uniref:hypothetical protein n=1 Tax=Halobacterium zhouii TaxID=2902624 RepID=UPI001E2AA8EF|nr:hypothetical protein [Halobacterium zhouii]
MYEETLSTDWSEDDLDREEAVWRAYALGVAAVLGEQNPDEYRQLVTAVGRSLVEMAYDEGKSSAAELDREFASGGLDDLDSDFPSREDAVWSKLISYEQGGGGESGFTAEASSRTDLPELLEKIDLDSVTKDDLERLRLPEFLSGR